MARKIACVGFEIPGDDATYISFGSSSSLLDYDITVFDTSISGSYGYHSNHLGKPCLDDHDSFHLKEQLEHWRQELLAVLNAGQTVFVRLNSLEEVYIATGDKSYSGTGRNQKTTRHVTLCCNYDVIPGRPRVRSSDGTSMRLEGKGNVLAAYWSDFGEESEYRVLVDSDHGLRLIVTRTGSRLVGVQYRFENMSGAMYLLPYLDFRRNGLTYKKNKETYWTKKAISLGKRFVKAIVELDKVTRQASGTTPTPTWLSSSDDYLLPAETRLNGELLRIESQIETLNSKKAEVLGNMANETILKGLLYENGTRLERAIIEALKMMGFEVSRFREGDSEFDVVFSCADGRMLGEAEGKDSKAINVDKLRQLEMNVHEDLQREEIDEPAKAVLFGNAYRLKRPTERGEFFTQKCLIAATRSQTALVRSTDLFGVARFLSGRRNARFAKKCRSAILKSVGIVEFPDAPKPKMSCSENVSSR